MDLRGKTPKALIYNEIRRQPDKKFFFELEFTNHRNTLFDTNPQITDPDLFIFSPQINNISMEMPKIPLLTNWNSINKVFKLNSLYHKIFLYFNFLNKEFGLQSSK